MARTRVRIRDRSSPRLSRLKSLSKKANGFEVGVFNPTLATIGLYHEFGTATIPRRSFIRAWFAENSVEVRRRLKIAQTNLYNGGSSQEAMAALGTWAVRGIQTRILNKIPPKLAPSTIRQKDGTFKTTPLIDRGRLFRAIEFKLETKGTRRGGNQ